MQKILIYWRDIPSQVIIKRGRARAKAALPPRFQEAIDRAAMTANRGSSDAYIADWRRDISSFAADGEIDELAQLEAASLEAQYDEERLQIIVKNRGLEAQ